MSALLSMKTMLSLQTFSWLMPNARRAEAAAASWMSERHVVRVARPEGG